jgi:hypothetical protein
LLVLLAVRAWDLGRERVQEQEQEPDLARLNWERVQLNRRGLARFGPPDE